MNPTYICLHVVAMLLVIAVVDSLQFDSTFEIDSSGRFIDSCSRTRVFHGVNAVYKKKPYFPITKKFHPTLSLCEKDFDYLNAMGMNIIRLGVMWPGFEPRMNEYNFDYLRLINETVYKMGKRGIYTVLDFHQDLLSPKLCGEGVPDYVLNVTKNACSQGSFVSKFMHLIGVCKSFHDFDIKFDKDTGYADPKSCLKNNFATYYRTPEVSSAFQYFYDSEFSRKRFSEFWRKIAMFFKDNPYVIGYDLMNEPWGGDVWSDPKLLIPGHADRYNIQGLYSMLSDVIRGVSPKKILFYENTQFPDSMGILLFANGFEEPPGGAKFASKSVLSYHVYSCARGWGFCDENGDPSRQVGQLEYIKRKIELRQKDAERLGSGGFISEFGACGDSPSCLKELSDIADAAEPRFTSWAYWQYKYFADPTTQSGDLEGLFSSTKGLLVPKARALARPYAVAIGGKPISTSFDSETLEFELTFISSSSSLCDSEDFPTEIFSSKDYVYTEGYEFKCNPDVEFTLPTGKDQIIKVYTEPGIQYKCTISPKMSKEHIFNELVAAYAESVAETHDLKKNSYEDDE